MIDDAAAAGRAGRAARRGQPAGHPAGRVHRRRGCRVLLQVRGRVPAGGGVLRRAAQPGRLHDHHHAGPQRAGQDAGRRCWPRCRRTSRTWPTTWPSWRPGQDKHRVLAMASSRTFGLDASQGGDQLRAALRAGPARRRLGLQDLHRGHRDGEGAGHQLPDGGAAQRLRLADLRRRRRPAAAGAQLRQLPGADVAARTRWRCRRTPRSSSWRSSPGCRTWWTWRSGWA